TRARASGSDRLMNVVAASARGAAICLWASTSRRSPVTRSSSQPSTMNPRSEYTDLVPGAYSSGSRAASSEIARRSDGASAACRQNGRCAGSPEQWLSSWRIVTRARRTHGQNAGNGGLGDGRDVEKRIAKDGKRAGDQLAHPEGVVKHDGTA